MDVHSFCAVPTPNTVYAGPRTKEEFDLIPLPVRIHDWKTDDVETLLQNDGQQWERRCHSKYLDGRENGTGFDVIFQWFDRRPVAAPAAELETQA